MSFFNFQPQTDIDRGREAIKYFHNASVYYPAYGLTMDTLITRVAPGSEEIFLDSLGFAISSIELSTGALESAMESLATQAQGNIPKQAAFFRALSDQAQNFGVMDWMPYVAKESAKDVLKGAQAVGDAVIDTGKSLLVIGPLLVVMAVVFIGYAKTRAYAGR